MSKKPIQLTLSIEIDEKTAKLFLQSSLERVFNTAIRVNDEFAVSPTPMSDYIRELIAISNDDLTEWKPVAFSMWNALHDAIFRHNANMPIADKPYVIRK